MKRIKNNSRFINKILKSRGYKFQYRPSRIMGIYGFDTDKHIHVTTFNQKTGKRLMMFVLKKTGCVVKMTVSHFRVRPFYDPDFLEKYEVKDVWEALQKLEEL